MGTQYFNPLNPFSDSALAPRAVEMSPSRELNVRNWFKIVVLLLVADLIIGVGVT